MIYVQRFSGFRALDGFAAVMAAPVSHGKNFSGSFKLGFENLGLAVAPCPICGLSVKCVASETGAIYHAFESFVLFTEKGTDSATYVVPFMERTIFQNLLD